MSLFHSPLPAVPGFLKDERQFSLGAVTVSAAAQEALHSARLSLESLLARHTARDYGEISESDSYNNDVNILGGGHVTSVYSVQRFAMGLSKEQIWVTTLLREKWTYVCLSHEVGNIF